MSIVPSGRELKENSRREIKSNSCNSFIGDIDLLNYDNEVVSSSDSCSAIQLHLLLHPSEIDRLVRQTSSNDCSLSSSSRGEAKKPGFFLKQDMKTVVKSNQRKYQEDSECVLDTFLPRVPSRRNSSSHSMTMFHQNKETNYTNRASTCTMDFHLSEVTEDELSTDNGNDLLSSRPLAKRSLPKRSEKLEEDLLNDAWLKSSNPDVFSKKRFSEDPTSKSESVLIRDKVQPKLSSLNDLTLPFYGIKKRVEREVEKDLRSLGYTNEAEVNWNSLYSPKRKDLLRVIHHRLCNHINPDIVVLLDDKEFYCHRILLQSYSEFFDDLKNSDGANRVDITNMNVTENAFLTIYTWMLTIGQGGFQLLTKQNIAEVLLACQVLRVRDFENQVIAFLENDEVFTEDTAYFIFENAVELKIKNLQLLMVPRIRNFFLILVSSKNFLELDLESICLFLRSDNIAIHCEQEVFFAASRWLRYRWPERKEFVEEVMSCIRFGLMTPLELVDIRKTEQNNLSEISNDPKVQRLIDEGLVVAVKNSLSNEDGLSSRKIPPRTCLGKSKTYKTFEHFLDFLKEIKKNPKMITHISESRESCKSENSNYSKKQKINYNLIVPKACNSGTSLLFPDSGVISKSSSNDSKLPKNSAVHVFRAESIDASTNTGSDLISHSTTMIYLNELLSKRLKSEEKVNKLPEAKVSEPVMQTVSRCAAPKPSLRDQAAVLIQAAYRGHKTRVKLLNALSANCKETTDESCEESVQASPCMSESTRNLSIQSVSHLTSETKVQEERTKNGSTFHLFQNSILVFGGLDPNNTIGNDNSSTTVYRYIADKNKWEIFGHLPEPRYYHDVTILKGKVYLAGGVNPTEEDLQEMAVSKSVWSLDPTTGIWQRETDMLTERKNFSLVAAGGFLYAIGGHNNESTVLSSVERYDPHQKKWIYVASLTHGRTGAAVCKHNHMIWVAGGIAALVKHQVIKHVECYDPKRDVWMTKSPLRFGRAFGTLVSLKGNLYLVGGASKKSSTAATSTPAIDIWDERNKEWKLKTEMTIPRHNHSVAYVGSQMVILGGTTTLSMRCVTTVESWCVNRGTWIRGITSLPAPLIGHSTITLPLDVP